MSRPTSSSFMRGELARARRHSIGLRMVVAREEPGWRDRMACAGMDPELFHGRHEGTIADARDVCAKCPVVMSCLAFAEATERGRARYRLHGVVGGLTAAERWRARRAPESTGQLRQVGAHLRGSVG